MIFIEEHKAEQIKNLGQIITHPGRAHRDDYLATGYLLWLNWVLYCKRELPLKATPPVNRKKLNSEFPKELENKDIAVIDCGGKYEPQLFNFDHHQEEVEGECSITLLMQYFQPEFYYFLKNKKFQGLREVEVLDEKGPKALEASGGNFPDMVSGGIIKMWGKQFEKAYYKDHIIETQILLWEQIWNDFQAYKTAQNLPVLIFPQWQPMSKAGVIFTPMVLNPEVEGYLAELWSNVLDGFVIVSRSNRDNTGVRAKRFNTNFNLQNLFSDYMPEFLHKSEFVGRWPEEAFYLFDSRGYIDGTETTFVKYVIENSPTI